MMRWFYLTVLAVGVAFSAHAEPTVVKYQHDGQTYEGRYASPADADNAPLVLLVHDWDGLTEYEVKRTQMLRDAGYVVFAADFFGEGVRPTKVDAKKHLTGELYDDREKMRALADAAIEAAAKAGADTSKVVMVGYCFGGAVALEMARAGRDWQGFVSVHGLLKTPEGQDYSNTRGEVLVQHGGADDMVSLNQFADLAKQLEADAVNHEMISYGGAPHAFTVLGDERYHAQTDKRAWTRLLDFLETTTME